MRRGFVALIVAVPAFAAAEPKPSVVWQDRVHHGPRGAALSVSRTLYLNNCLPNGCTVSPGFDDSITNRSSIPSGPVTLDGYSHGEAHWQELVQCVRDTFKPFDIAIVTDDPGTASHFEVMIAGKSHQLDPQLDAGGVAPFLSCGAIDDNVISFVFANQSGAIPYLCAAVAQEASHVWGLDHEMNADDPMTYLDVGSSKRFQNDDATCGEFEPRSCYCDGGSTQNSFAYLRDTFGLNPSLGESVLTLTTPTDGQWVRAHFPIAAVVTSDLSLKQASLSIDGSHAAQADPAILVFNAPELSVGQHAVTLSVTDAIDRTLVQMVTVNLVGPCDREGSCTGDFLCFGGSCVPGADVAGGFGSDCTASVDCATGTCASDGSAALCTGACDADGACPSGFACNAGANVCWPSSESAGCATTRGGAGLLLFGAFALAVVRRRTTSSV